MATVTYSTAASSSIRPWYGAVTTQVVNRVIWSDGSNETTFNGRFGFIGGKITSGTLSTFTQTIDSAAYLTITGLNLFGPSLQKFWDIRNYSGFLKAIFAGNDSVTGSDEGDELRGFGGGRDTIIGGDGDDTILGGSGNDSITGDDGSDVINGGSGAMDTISGGAGDDQISAGGYAQVSGGEGSDSYFLNSGTVRITEEESDEEFEIDEVTTKFSYKLSENIERLTLTSTTHASGTGNNDDNVIIGNLGNNLLRGGGGNDVLNGSSGNDTLSGGAGTETATNGFSDILEGGLGKDVFLFEFTPNATTSISQILDFGIGDRIALNFHTFYDITDRYIGFRTSGNFKVEQFYDISTDLPTVLDIFGEVDPVATAAAQLKIRITYDPTTGILMYDPDGVGTHVDPTELGTGGTPVLVDLPAVQIALVEGAPSLSYLDFIVVKM